MKLVNYLAVSTLCVIFLLFAYYKLVNKGNACCKGEEQSSDTTVYHQLESFTKLNIPTTGTLPVASSSLLNPLANPSLLNPLANPSLLNPLANSSLLNPGCITRTLFKYKAVDTGRRYTHPPLVHYVKLGVKELQLNFLEYTSVLSVYKFLKPDKITFYTYHSLHGKYWNKIKQWKNIVIELRLIPPINKLGGKPVKFIEHVADYWKLYMVYKYGGLALDFDVVILNGARLKHLQSMSECVLAAQTEYINGGFYSCIPNSIFILTIIENYHKDYRPSSWLYNISYYSLHLLTSKKSTKCHNVYVDGTICISPDYPYRMNWLKPNKVAWRNKTAAHYFVKKQVPHVGEDILKANYSLAEMMKYVHMS